MLSNDFALHRVVAESLRGVEQAGECQGTSRRHIKNNTPSEVRPSSLFRSEVLVCVFLLLL